MRIPAELLWEVGGDLYSRIFKQEYRRTIESYWQALKDITADALAYNEHVKSTRNIFQVDPFEPWGDVYVEPTRVQTPSQFQGRMLGGRKEGGFFWYAYFPQDVSLPQKGSINSGAQAIQYDQSNTRDLASGGIVGQFGMPSVRLGRSLRDRWELDHAPSEVFGPHLEWRTSSGDQRWGDEGSHQPQKTHEGFVYDVTGLQWSILKDHYYMSGRDRWKQVWVIDITEWPSSDSQRAVTVSSWDDQNNKYMARMYESGGDIHVEFGQSAGQGLELTIPSVESTQDWADILHQASPQQPAQLEIVLEHIPHQPAMTGEIWLDGHRAQQSSPFVQIAPGRRGQTLDIINEKDTVTMTLDQLVVSEGTLWQRSPDRSLMMSFESRYGHVYDVDPDIIRSKGARSRAWDLAPRANLKSYNPPTLEVQLQEGWAEYAPEYVRFDPSGGRLVFEKTHHDARGVTYKKILDQGGTFDPSETLRLHEWHLDPEEIEWIGDGRFSTDHPIPPDDMWLLDTRARGVDLYGRYGRRLGVPQRRDSESYLATLRGMHYGLWSETTPDNMARACSLAVQVPYVEKRGEIETIEPAEHPQTGEDAHRVELSDEAVYVDPYWKSAGILKKPGEMLEAFDPLVEGVDIHDWISNPDLLERHTEPWEQWGTFVVDLDVEHGINRRVAEDIIRLVEDTKNRHHGYQVVTTSDRLEPHDSHERLSPGGVVSHMEDAVFEDGGTVINNDHVNPEGQSDEAPTMGGGSKMGVQHALDHTHIRITPTHLERGRSRGNIYYEDIDLLDHEADVLTRDLETVESDAHLQRASLRTEQTRHWDTSNQTYQLAGYPRGYTLCWFYKDSTGDTLAPQRTIDAEQSQFANTIEDIEFTSSLQAQLVHGGSVATTDDYGYNWSQTNITSSTLKTIRGDWAGGTNGELWKQSSGSWSLANSPTASGDTIISIDTYQSDLYVLGHDGSEVTAYRSQDGGSSWASVVVGSFGSSPPAWGIQASSSDIVWVATTNGLYKVDFGGSSSSQSKQDIAYQVKHLEGDHLIYASSGGTIYETQDGGSNWSSHSLITGYDIRDIQAYDPYRWIAVDDHSTVSWTHDGGESWSYVSVDTTTAKHAVCARHDRFVRFATDGSYIYRWI